MLANRVNKLGSLVRLSSLLHKISAINRNQNRQVVALIRKHQAHHHRFYATQSDNFSELKFEEELKKQKENSQQKKSEESERERIEKEFDQETNEDETVEDAILRRALKYVPELGFTTEALSKACTELGYSVATKGIFQHGAFDLIDFFYKDHNAKLASYLENLIKEGKVKRKNELCREAIIYRLKLTQPYLKQWTEAMAIIATRPTYLLTSLENLMRLCDEIWYQLGDNSTDYNWYTKRFTLATIYKSTELFMLQDRSENFADTIKFLDRRFEDLNTLNQVKSEFSNLSQHATGSFAVLKNILKLN